MSVTTMKPTKSHWLSTLMGAIGCGFAYLLLVVLVIIVAIIVPLLTGVSLWPLRSGVG